MKNTFNDETDEYFSIIKSIIGKDLIDTNKYFGELQIIVSKDKIFDVLTKLHSNSSIPFDQLIDITAIDYPENLPRFEMVYLLLSTALKKRLTVKILVNEGDLIKSCVSIFKSANWSEREIWDMFGIFFSGHPDLRRLLTDYGFEGHPLRKDFPLTGHSEVRYSEDKKKVISEPVKLEQNYRNFDYESPWAGTKYIKEELDNNDKKN